MMNRRRRAQARPALWLLSLALLLGSFAPLVSSGGALAEDPPAVEATDVPPDPVLTVTDPTAVPTEIPVMPTDVPVEPTLEPTDVPVEPTSVPTDPTSEPSMVPSVEPSVAPPVEPSVVPSATPSVTPTGEPMLRMGIQSLIEPSWSISKTVSTSNVGPGELVLFTVTVSGAAEAGTVFAVHDIYSTNFSTLSSPQIVTQTNVTGVPAISPINMGGGGLNWYVITLSPAAAGAFSLTFTVEATTSDLANGVLGAFATLYLASDPTTELARSNANVTVAPGEIPTVGTITKVASNSNPFAGETVTFTITVNGRAPAGTALGIIDLYALGGLSLSAVQGVAHSNLTDPDFDLQSSDTYNTQIYYVAFTTVNPGAFSLTYQVEATVALNAPSELTANALLSNNSQPAHTNMDTDTEDLTVATATTGTITKVASDTTPDQGDVVTFTITVSGSAEAGTGLLLLDGYQAAGLVLSNPRISDPVNVENTVVGPWSNPPYNGYNVTFSTVVDGAFSLTFKVDGTVAATATGTIATGGGLYDESGPEVNLDSTNLALTVTIPTSGTITKVASDTTPDQGDVVTLTITVSGRAMAGTPLLIHDLYTDVGLAPGTPQIGVKSNVTEPIAAPFVYPGDTQGSNLTFSTVVDGAFSLTFTVEVTVATTATGTLVTAASLESRGAQPKVLDYDIENLSVTIPTSFTMLSTASPTAAAAGETVTVTTTLSGRAMAGIPLFLEASTNSSDLTLGSLSISNLQNLTSSAGTTTANNQLTVIADGAFSATVTTVYTVALDVVPGVRPYATTCLYPGTDATDETAKLCYGVPIQVPLVAPQVTKTTTDTTPRPGEPVTYTITVSGNAALDTVFTLGDVLPPELVLGEVTVVTQDNLDPAVGESGGTNALSLPLAVRTDGPYTLTVTVESVVNEGVARGTVVTNTACVDVTDGPQDTCADADITVQRPLTFLERLILRLVAILRGIIGGL